MNFKSIIAVLAVSLSSATFAHATAISGTIGLGGNGTYSTTTGQFTAGSNINNSSYNAYVNASDNVAGDSLSNYTMFNSANFYDFNTSNLGSGAAVFTTAENGKVLSFELISMVSNGTNSAGPGFVGTGILSETGYDNTAATFSLNTNSQAGTVITFNTVAAAATPEPSSLILLGTGALGAAGMMRRKFMSNVNA